MPLAATVADAIWGRPPSNEVFRNWGQKPAQRYLIDTLGSNNHDVLAVTSAYSHDDTTTNRVRVVDFLTVSQRAFLGAREFGSRIYSLWSLACVLQIRREANRRGHWFAVQEALKWLESWWFFDAMVWAPAAGRSLWLGLRSYSGGTLDEGAFELPRDIALYGGSTYEHGWRLRGQWPLLAIMRGEPLYPWLRSSYHVPEAPPCNLAVEALTTIRYSVAGEEVVVAYQGESRSGSTPAVLGAVAAGGAIQWLPGGYDPPGPEDPETVRWRHSDEATCELRPGAEGTWVLDYQGKVPGYERIRVVLHPPADAAVVRWGPGGVVRGTFAELLGGGVVQPSEPGPAGAALSAEDVAELRRASGYLSSQQWARRPVREAVETVADVVRRMG